MSYFVKHDVRRLEIQGKRICIAGMVCAPACIGLNVQVVG